jgi:hypothetical protein
MDKVIFKSLILMIFTNLIAVPALAINTPVEDKSIYSIGYPEAAPTRMKRKTFEELDRPNMRLRGVQSSNSVDFTNRVDHIITDLKLKFSYTHSPALIPGLSHIKVYLNEEIMSVLPIKPLDIKVANTGLIHQEISLDPKLIYDFNSLRFELIGHYTMECEDPFHSSIWTEISKSSYIEYTEQQLPFESQLERFPEPFYDHRDYSKLVLPISFTSSPDETTIQAASILTSWFGAQSDWRGAEFPVKINKIAKTHSIVFATNDNKPEFLSDYPDADGPTVEIISNPNHRYQKMLLILGRDSKELKTAVEGIALGLPLMTGRTALIDNIEYIQPRKAYDAPRWLRSDREVTFGELVDFPSQLQVDGYNSSPVKLDVRVAPDLFTWHSSGIPIDLKYRYTPPTPKGESRLNMTINDKFIQGYKLRSEEHSGLVIEDIKIPLLSTDDSDKDKYFNVPGFKVDVKNELAFKFIFSTEKEGFCTTTTPQGTIGVIDDSSTIDVSSYEHYIAMPDLNAFAQGGFPYTKYADLNESIVLLPQKPNNDELSLLFSVMGHIGATTGYPAIKAEVKFANPSIELDNKDILMIGHKHDLIKDESESDNQITALFEQSNRLLKQAIYETEPQEYARSVPDAATKVTLKSYGPLAVIAGFESPFTSDRSVIALMASEPHHYGLLISALTEGDKIAKIKGAASIITQEGIKASYIGERYYVGNLPIHKLIWFHLADHPILLAILSLITLLLLSFILWRVLTTLARKRLAKHEEE